MKAIKLLLIFISLFSVSIGYSQTKAGKKAAGTAKIEALVNKSVNDNKIEIIIDRIVPFRGTSKSTLDGYFLRISNDSLSCHLPYFGQMQTAIFDTDELSIIFKDYTIQLIKKTGKKREHKLSFELKSSKSLEIFVFNIDIFPNGNTTINVAPSERDHIMYYGKIKY